MCSSDLLLFLYVLLSAMIRTQQRLKINTISTTIIKSSLIITFCPTTFSNFLSSSYLTSLLSSPLVELLLDQSSRIQSHPTETRLQFNFISSSLIFANFFPLLFYSLPLSKLKPLKSFRRNQFHVFSHLRYSFPL